MTVPFLPKLISVYGGAGSGKSQYISRKGKDLLRVRQTIKELTDEDLEGKKNMWIVKDEQSSFHIWSLIVAARNWGYKKVYIESHDHPSNWFSYENNKTSLKSEIITCMTKIVCMDNYANGIELATDDN